MINKKYFRLGIIFLLLILLAVVFSQGASAYLETSYYTSGAGASFIDSSSHYSDREVCSAGEDFLLQIAPFGCTPAVVRSDLLEEQNVPVFCQVAATKINPLIDVDAIESMSFSGQYPKEISGVGFHPARAALGVNGDLNSPVLNNVGYVVIVLKKNENESSMPDYVEGNLTARLRYDIENAFGIGKASFYLPEMTDDEFARLKDQYSFWERRAYIRAESVDNEGAVISVYDKNGRAASVGLKKGEISNKLSLPSVDDCLAKFQLKLEGFENPDTRAKLNINGDIVEVAEKGTFLDGRCSVRKIEKQGISEKVTINCREDSTSSLFAGSSTFNLMISPRINLTICDYEPPVADISVEQNLGSGVKTVNCRTEVHTVGDYLFETTDNERKSVYLGYAEYRKDQQNEELYTLFFAKTEKTDKMSDDEIDSMARQVKASFIKNDGGIAAFNVASGLLNNLFRNTIRIGKWIVKGDEIKLISSSQKGEYVLTKNIRVNGIAEPADVDWSKLVLAADANARVASGGKDEAKNVYTDDEIDEGVMREVDYLEESKLSNMKDILKANYKIIYDENSEGEIREKYKSYLAKNRFGNNEIEDILAAKKCDDCGDKLFDLNPCGAKECIEVGKLLRRDCYYENLKCKDKADLSVLNSAIQGVADLIGKYGGDKTYSYNNDIKLFVDELAKEGILTERELKEIKGTEEYTPEGFIKVGENNLNEIEDILISKRNSYTLSGYAVIANFEASSCQVPSSITIKESNDFSYVVNKIRDNQWENSIDEENTLTDADVNKLNIDGKISDSNCVKSSSSQITPTTPAAVSEIASGIKSNYESAIKDYNTLIESFSGEPTSSGSKVTYGEEALYQKILLGAKLGQRKTIIEWCNQFKERYPSSSKNLNEYCEDKKKLASSSIASRDVSINGVIKQISLEGIYEPSQDDYSATILVNGPNGVKKSITLTKDQIVYLDDFRSGESIFTIFKTGAPWPIYLLFDTNSNEWYFTDDLNHPKTKVSEFNNKFCGGAGGDVLASMATGCGSYEPYKDVINGLTGYKNDIDGGVKFIEDNGGTKTGTNEYIQLVGLDTDKATVNINLRPSGVWDATKGFITNTNKRLNKGVIESFGSGYTFSLTDINLKKSAKVSVVPSIDNTGTETNFSFKIGIEKRAIQLSPEKTREKIAQLNETIAKWEDRSEKLGKVVKGLKTACLGTGTFLTVKNFINDALISSGKSIARQQVMRGEGGWYEQCAKMVSNKEKGYTSVEQCLLKESDNIEKDVDARYNVLQQQNEEIKKLEQQYGCQTREVFTEKHIDSTCFIEHYSSDVKSELGSCTGGIKIDSTTTVECSEIVNMIDKDAITIEKLRGMQLDWRTGNKEGYEKVLKEIYVNNQEAEKAKQLAAEAEKAGFKGIQASIGRTKDTTTEYYNGYTVPQGGGKGSITEGTNLRAYVFRGKQYFLGLKKGGNDYYVDKIYDINGVELSEKDIDNSIDGAPVVFADPNVKEIKNVVFKLADPSTYKHLYKSSSSEPGVNQPVLRYYETEPFAGLPAIVPFDCTNGWYVYAQQVTGVGGSLRAYDDSGVARNYYICNVGENGIEEMKGGDDICRMINKGTGQPYDKFGGMTDSEFTKIFNKAESALETASRRHKEWSSSKGSVNIGSCSGVKVGSPAVDIPDVQCQDFMSPKDCQLLFNVCDPVVCPSSRCDFGGAYPVKDVIQSGIVGSVLLCAPNIKDGIYVPVCLSGVKAGIDGLLSVFHSYRDCLQESLDTGKTVGICDEIYSIHLCEFFWRQSLPLAKLIVPKTIEILLGQNIRGGGEYLGVASAWQNAEKSIDYFAQYYAGTSYEAFKARVAEGVGDAVCQNSISATYPDGGSVLDSLTDPDSPPQFHGRFDEIPFTTATNPPISQYKVYYHIYAGDESRAYFEVYLKTDQTSSYYQDVTGKRYVASGYITTGGYASETKDFTAPSGYKQLCINVNGQEECGFKEVSTSFAVNYVEDEYLASQASTTNVNSESECISGSVSAYNLLNLNLNLQGAAEDFIDPKIYNEGIIRICASDNPGKGTDGNANSNNSRWVQIGYCDQANKIKCWQDEESVKNVIKNLDTLKDVLSKQSNNTLATLMKEGNYKSKEEINDLIKKLESMDDPREKIKAITEVIEKVFWNDQKAKLYFERGKAFGEIAKELYSKVKKDDTKVGDTSDSGAISKTETTSESGVTGRSVCESKLCGGTSVGGQYVMGGDSCWKEVGEKVIEYANEIKDSRIDSSPTYSYLSDNNIAKELGVSSFGCLVAIVARQEGCLAHCIYQDGQKALYCDGSKNNVIKGDNGNAIGVMQLTISNHGERYGFKDNVQTAAAYLITNYNPLPKSYNCGGKNYAGWMRSLRYYNGWNTNCNKGDVNYVENVLNKRDEIYRLFPECKVDAETLCKDYCGGEKNRQFPNSDFKINPYSGLTKEQCDAKDNNQNPYAYSQELLCCCYTEKSLVEG